MARITTHMDYTVSNEPIQIIDRVAGRSKLNIPSLSILNVGHLPGRILYRRKARFGHFAAVYIAGGSGTYRVNGGDTQPVKAGSLFFFYPGAVFDFGPDSDSTWDEYFFTLEGSRIEEWTNGWLTELDRVKQVEADDAHLNKIDRIFLLMESGAPNNLDRAALLVESLLFELMLKAKERKNPVQTDDDPGLMEDLSNSVYQMFDPVKICERRHISLSTLRRLVKKYSGYPLNDYMHRLKIAEAKNILMNTDLTIKEIADRFGYQDMFYFSRIFKKYTGVSPRYFRNSV